MSEPRQSMVRPIYLFFFSSYTHRASLLCYLVATFPHLAHLDSSWVLFLYFNLFSLLSLSLLGQLFGCHFYTVWNFKHLDIFISAFTSKSCFCTGYCLVHNHFYFFGWTLFWWLFNLQNFPFLPVFLFSFSPTALCRSSGHCTGLLGAQVFHQFTLEPEWAFPIFFFIAIRMSYDIQYLQEWDPCHQNTK